MYRELLTDLPSLDKIEAMMNLMKVTMMLASLLMSVGFLQAFPKVEAYHRPDFRGERLLITEAWSASHSRSHWNDAINALVVPRGFEVHAFEHSNFRGRSLVIVGDWSSADDPYWQNRISSLRLVPVGPPRRGGRDYGHHRDCRDGYCAPRCHYHRPQPAALLFEHVNYGGPSLRVSGEWSIVYPDEFWNDRISSIRVPRGYALIVYEHSNFRGRSWTITGNWNACGYRDFWNDRISSLRLVPL